MRFLSHEGYSLPLIIRQDLYADLIYLTWTDDPLTTMTIQWHTINNPNPNPEVLYRRENSKGSWSVAVGTVRDMPVSSVGRQIHWTDIKGLSPDAGYEFRFAGDSKGKVYKFKTMPENLNDHPLKIATSSDSHDHYSADWFVPMTKLMGGTVAGGLDADIIVGIGDFTYDNGRAGQRFTDEWIDLLKHFQDAFVNSEGYIIPMIQTVGNHDTLYQVEGITAPDNAPNFKALFAFPTQDDLPTQRPFYGRLNFGDYLQVIMIDRPWGAPVDEVTPWVRDVIDDRFKHVIPFIHYQLYRYRDGVEGMSEGMIGDWEQSFIDSGVKALFDGHDHIYKRTHPIINGEVNENGIVHFGSGAWQDVRTHRHLNSEGEPIVPTTFVEDFGFNNINEEKAKHFHLITLTNESIKVQAISDKGNVNHTFERSVL